MKRHNISIQFGMGFFAVMAIAVYYGGDVFQFVLAAAAHELGHIAAISLTGGADMRIELKASGIYIIINEPSFSIKREAIILLFGPMTGLFAAVVGKGFGSFSEISATLSVVNLLPIKGTDGGSLLKLIYPECLVGRRRMVLMLFSAALLVLPSVFMGERVNALAISAAAMLFIKSEVCDGKYI